MRKIITIIILLVYCFAPLYATIERWFKASDNVTWAFEFKNKTNEPVYIQLLSPKQRTNYVRNIALSGVPPIALIPVDPKLDPWDKKGVVDNDWYDQTNPNTRVSGIKGKTDADAGYLRLSNFFNPKEEYTILIWTQNKPDLINSYKQPTYKYLIKQNENRKRILLTWENNKLRPQKSNTKKTILSFSPKSGSGISLTDNIKEQDIVDNK